MKILVVDDHRTNRKLLRAILEDGGHDVLEAGDGVEALETLRESRVDAIVSDVLMPNMDGFRLCLEIRKAEHSRTLPFIVYTSTYDSPSDRKLAKTVGADLYLVKPAPAATILRALDELATKARDRAAPPASGPDEVDVVKQYNAALVRKLEDKNQELVQANAELRASEERFRQLAENIHEVFWLTDPTKDQMLYVSPAYERIWGRSCDELMKHPRAWLEAIHPDDLNRVEAAMTERQRDGTYDEEYRIVRPDGATRWIRDRAFPVRDESGNVYRIAGVAEDVTSRKQLEAQFLQAQKMEAIGQLSSGVAHDFNNLLTVIQVRVSMLEHEETLTPEMKEAVDEILQAVARAANLTRQLLVFSRRQVMRTAVFDARETIVNLSRMLRRVLREDVALEIDRGSGSPRISGDPGMFEQVAMNLVVNARDAMPNGGRLLIAVDDVELDEARSPTAPSGRYVRLSVTDSGTGIDAETLPHIFEPFFTTKEVGKGTGLGLATVYGIVEQHRGWIDVKSKVGEGTTFEVHIPAHVGETTSRAREAVPAPRYTALGRETILLIEDDVSVRRMLSMLLKQTGYAVLEAGSGPEARAVWCDHRGDVRLLLTDVVLPGGASGWELARELRSEEPGLPVVFMSGYNHESASGRVEAEGNVEFLGKPFEIEQLRATLRKLLDRSGG
ncbi:response regulator [Congregicoccus parvus]|uniref:response regulator n=1 Tax=Congregicoccus parvus TaxID=3081749 RepID=UPI003FA592DC